MSEAKTSRLGAADFRIRVSYANHLRAMFPDLELTADDVRLLEPHQIAALAGRVDTQVMADAIAANPEIADHLIERYPPIGGYLEHLPESATSRDPAATQDFLWEVADWFSYVKAPEMYDAHALHNWDFSAITEEFDLAGCTVIDAGAGTGRISFAAAPLAAVVYALEPTERLRRYIDEKAAAHHITNIKTMAGTLDAVPLPAAVADAVLTCRAIGWSLDNELEEIERVIRRGGIAIHLGMPDPPVQNQPLHDGLIGNGYTSSPYVHAGDPSLKYVRRF